MPQADWPTFFIEQPGETKPDRAYENSLVCFYGRSSVGSFEVVTVTSRAFDDWLDGSMSVTPTVEASIEGYAALTFVASNFDDPGCSAVVDVAHGQVLLTSAIPYGGKEDEVPDKCAKAYELAESAMSTLVGMR